jgi:gamma-glutamyl:cysteine ligase YbdK (ATP-grasp superfamily)
MIGSFERRAPPQVERLVTSRWRSSACSRPASARGATLGAELEVALVDRSARPLPLNRAVLAGTLDPRVTLELDRFNLECNLRPAPLAGRPFAAMAGEMGDALAELRRAAAEHGGRIAVIGILPTLRLGDPRAGR